MEGLFVGLPIEAHLSCPCCLSLARCASLHSSARLSLLPVILLRIKPRPRSIVGSCVLTSVDIVGHSLNDAKIMESLEDDGEDGGDQQQQDTSQAGRTLASLRETPTCVGISDSALERLSDRLRELKGTTDYDFVLRNKTLILRAEILHYGILL